jgi:hypothetical protein
MENRVNHLQQEIASLEEALREAAEQAREAERTLEGLEAHRNEAAGRLAIARQAAANYTARIEERRQALEAQIKSRYLEAVAVRDDAVKRVAEAISNLIALFERLDAARAEAAERAAEAESNLRARVDREPEPAELESEWARLVELVTTRAQLRLEEELVEAALASPGGYDIRKLPKHLQVIARRRRTERMREANRQA